MVKVLFEDIPACWKEGKSAYVFERQQYVTVGASLARNPPPPVKGSGSEAAVGAVADRLMDKERRQTATGRHEPQADRLRKTRGAALEPV